MHLGGLDARRHQRSDLPHGPRESENNALPLLRHGHGRRLRLPGHGLSLPQLSELFQPCGKRYLLREGLSGFRSVPYFY